MCLGTCSTKDTELSQSILQRCAPLSVRMVVSLVDLLFFAREVNKGVTEILGQKVTVRNHESTYTDPIEFGLDEHNERRA